MPIRSTSTRWLMPERGQHRAARDPVGLDEERLDRERERERGRHHHHELDQRARASDFFAFVTPSVRRRVPPSAAGPASCGAVGGTDSSDSAALDSSAPASACISAARRVGLDVNARLRPRRLLDSLLGLLAGIGRMQQLALDRHLGAGVAALAHAGTLADATAQVVQLGPADVAASRYLDPLDLRRVKRKRSLDPDAERLLADRERLAGPVTLALDDDPFEHLGPPPRSLDHLEVDAKPVTGVERRYSAELGALQAVDHGAHGNADPLRTECATRRGLTSQRSAPARGGLW